MKIGDFVLNSNVLLAPMAGITDKPFRKLCRFFGAGLTTSEMITSNKALWHTKKTLLRSEHDLGEYPVSVQIAGSNPQEMALAAQINVEKGAQVIDINMGCPAKKVCNVLAGSALLKDEVLVQEILEAVVQAVNVPVTLKTRLGWDDEHKNIITIAQIAEQTGIKALTIHGRTRTQMYRGNAQYELIAQVKKQCNLPIIANGDITDEHKAKFVFDTTNADAIMIGRAAQGAPWIFQEILSFLHTGALPEPISVQYVIDVILEHLQDIYSFYGEYSGCRIARKHIAWYTKSLESSNEFRQEVYQLDNTLTQFKFVEHFLKSHTHTINKWPNTLSAHI
ncbi:tRNA dihydrouridine synthase DusB [Neisseria sp. Ec49-e6-T10]|uniref:tRNA dihydrouridine synthase DusB n=1 Tax=Neisseria sp. Ec49-e6-T10 TaxID=3140744 RepID=UPI003EC10738